MGRIKLRRERAARNAMNQKYTSQMYCKDTLFTDAIDFGGSSPGWLTIAEPILVGSKPDFARLLDFVRGRTILAQDRQVDNIISQFELRNETRSKVQARQEMHRKLGINHKRRMQFPFYNVTLKHD